MAELARRSGVTPTTSCYYARSGLLRPGREPDNGYRYFSGSDLRRVMFIRRAQALGLTIAEIKIVFEAVEIGEIPCDQVRSLVATRLRAIRERIAEPQATERRVSKALSTWQGMPGARRAEGEFCPLIERLELPATGS